MKRILQAANARHVIDHHRLPFQAADHRDDRRSQAFGRQIDFQNPAELPAARRRAKKQLIAGHEVQQLEEREAHATNAGILQACEFAVAQGVVHDPDAAIIGPERLEAVDQQRMIGGVDGRLNDDTALESERLVHFERRVIGRALRMIGGPFAGLVAFAADMDLAVAAPRWKLFAWRARIRIERQISRAVHDLG